MTFEDLEKKTRNITPNFVVKVALSDPEIVYIAGSDGAFKNINGNGFAVSAFSFGPESGIHGSTRVCKAVDSTAAETYGAYLAIKMANHLNLKNLCLCIDNENALKLVACALKTSIAKSQLLQRNVENYPFLETTFVKLYGLSEKFDYLQIIWVRGHQDSTHNNIFVLLNKHSDSLCTEKLYEVIGIIQRISRNQ